MSVIYRAYNEAVLSRGVPFPRYNRGLGDVDVCSNPPVYTGRSFIKPATRAKLMSVIAGDVSGCFTAHQPLVDLLCHVDASLYNGDRSLLSFMCHMTLMMSFHRLEGHRM